MSGPSRDADKPPAPSSLELALVHEHHVGADDSDHLGHMSIRRYAEIAEAAAPRLLASVGLSGEELEVEGNIAVAVDCYTRHYREQYSGAVLTLMAGFLDADERGFTVYAELRNEAREELAATFVHRICLQRVDDRGDVSLSDATVTLARAGAVAWPEHGRPRTLGLGEIRLASPEQLNGLALEEWNDQTIDDVDCDRFGRFAAGVTTLAWGREHDRTATLVDEERSWLFAADGGSTVGLANVESRRVYFEAPRAGVRVRTLAANIVIGSNRRVRREWSFEPESGRVFAAGDFVDLIFDTESRRAVDIPPGFRTELERWYHPELG